MCRLRLILLNVALTLLLCSPAFAQEAKPRKIIIKGDKYYPPYEFINSKGEPDGYNVELIKALMKGLGLDYDIELLEWDEAKTLLEERKIDMLMGASFSFERLNSFNFSLPHCYIRQTLVCETHKPQVNTLEQLRNKQIVIQNNSLAYDILTKSGITENIIAVDDIQEGLQMLSLGKYDVCICEEYIVKYLIKKEGYNNLNHYIISDIKPQRYSFAINKNDIELLKMINSQLEELQASGEYDIIFNKWFGNMEESPQISLITKLIIFICVFLLALSITVIVIIRGRIKVATNKMSDLNRELQLALKAGNISSWTYVIKEKKFYPLYGTPIANKHGTTLDTFINAISPEEVAPLLSLINSISNGELESGYFVVSYVDSQNSEKRIYLGSEMIAQKDIIGRITSIIGTQKDITETYLYQKHLKENNQKVELALKASDMEMWNYDVKERVITKEYASREDKEIVFTPSYFLSLIHPEDLSTVKSMIKILDRGETNYYEAEYRIKKFDKYRWEGVYISSFEKEGEKVTKYTIISRNNTDWKDMLKEQVSLKEKAELSDKLKTKFLANMSHEIRTPLNAVLGFSQLLVECTNQGEREHYIDVMIKNGNALLRLIEDILDLSKIEANQVDLHPEEFDFSKFFNAIGEEYQAKCANSDVELLCKNPYEKCIVTLDKYRIRQVLCNYLNNSIKFTKKGKIVMGYIVENEGMRIGISDTGIGIEKEKIDNIFERFEKANDFAQGTGLGLSINRAIINAMGGKIEVKSKYGEGSTFWTFIPCVTTIS